MFKVTSQRASWLGAVALAAAVLIPSLAFAGTCPASKSGTDVRAADSTPAKGVTDDVISSIELSKEPLHIDGRMFRLRKLVVQPGGVVPWHSHGDRPALIYIVSGSVYEYASTCSVPILHKAGDSTSETHGTAHWWKNTGKIPVVILSADLFAVKGDGHMM